MPGTCVAVPRLVGRIANPHQGPGGFESRASHIKLSNPDYARGFSPRRHRGTVRTCVGVCPVPLQQAAATIRPKLRISLQEFREVWVPPRLGGESSALSQQAPADLQTRTQLGGVNLTESDQSSCHSSCECRSQVTHSVGRISAPSAARSQKGLWQISQRWWSGSAKYPA